MTAVIIFWSFSLFVGTSAFAFALIQLQLSIGWSLAYATVAVVLARGIFSMARGGLILRERIGPGSDVLERTVETNRAVFWKLTLFVAVISMLYFAVMALAFRLAPVDAIAVLPSLLQRILTQLTYLFFLLGANFMLFFGPFYLHQHIGKTVLDPDNSNFRLDLEEVRGQKAAVNRMKRILQEKKERGVLLVGPRGTGSTVLAKAFASCLHMPIYIAKGSSFTGTLIGFDALSVYLMVRAARKRAEVWGGCVVFIDEIDSLGILGRDMLLVLMDSIDRPGFIVGTLSTIVNLMLDGLLIPRVIGDKCIKLRLRVPPPKNPNRNIVFLGATNERSLVGEALSRPGRFQRQIVFKGRDPLSPTVDAASNSVSGRRRGGAVLAIAVLAILILPATVAALPVTPLCSALINSATNVAIVTATLAAGRPPKRTGVPRRN